MIPPIGTPMHEDLLIRFRERASAGPYQAGVLSKGTRVVEMEAVGHSSDLDVVELLEMGQGKLLALIERARTNSSWVPIEDVELGPPVPRPEKLIFVGLNFHGHAQEAGIEAPKEPTYFAKFANSLSGPFSNVPIPDWCDTVDYEGELVAVIGRTCARVRPEEALAYVGGYCITNDLSDRSRQLASSQWTAGKAIEHFAPMGPGLLPAASVPDPQQLRITTRLNNEIVQDSSLTDMIFSVAEIVSSLSTLGPLKPGDVIALGTPSGIGHFRDPTRYLVPGDVVEVSIPPIGSISTTLIGANDA